MAYATDNCSVMRGTEDFVKAHCGRSIPRIPCVSHYLNGILKKMLKQEPLKTLWKSVTVCLQLKDSSGVSHRHKLLS